MRQPQKKYKRIVIKIGSSLFYAGEKLDIARFFEGISQLSALIKAEHKEIVIVSSGAIALGMNLLKLRSRPKKLTLLQAAAAVGQNALMDKYSEYFNRYGLSCAQILLTWDDFGSRQRYLNAKNTLLVLLKLGCVPIVNENDTISTEEIKFGDNDRLSALVAKLVEADLLIILSDVDGLLARDNQVIARVDEINAEIKSLASGAKNRASVGGMISKIEAAKIAVDSGIPCIIANGRKQSTGGIIFSAITAPEKAGTLFVSKKSLSARKHWIAFGAKPKGKVIVDDGAKTALLNRKSLLSVGVSAVEGSFEPGEVISIRDQQDVEFARGKVRITSKELEKVKGKRFRREIIHSDDLVSLSV